MMEKCNVVEYRRTPDEEFDREDEDWDKEAAADFEEAVTEDVETDEE